MAALEIHNVRKEFGSERVLKDVSISIDSGEFLADPEAHLRARCGRLGIDFMPEMLAWPPGPRDTDGPWAPHWYQRVWASTGFGPPPSETPELTGRAHDVASCCSATYERLREHRMRPARSR